MQVDETLRHEMQENERQLDRDWYDQVTGCCVLEGDCRLCRPAGSGLVWMLGGEGSEEAWQGRA
jgi:hypothetical protein